MAEMSRVIFVLTGCTAVGKTDLALRWAETHGAEIVSCDSLLFYRGMDVGTAKPTAADRARVPHHLIDLCAVTEPMDVTQYVTKARKAVAEILARHRRVLVTGGSGFYLKAFFSPIADEVEVPAELRAELRFRLENAGLAPLVAELRELNPDGVGDLDVSNPRRVLRALERCRASGRTRAELLAAFAKQPVPFADYEVRLSEVGRDKGELDARIDQRVAQMLRDGLVDEVRHLLAAGLRLNASAARAIGYRETIDWLEGRLPENGLAAMIARNTRALAKKQRTWFRTQLPPHPVVEARSGDLNALFVPPVQPEGD